MPTVTIINPISEMKTEHKMRVAAYCRVSSNRADQQNSYAVQLAYYGSKFSDSETETLVEIYADEGISGTRDDKRGEFQRMINDCRKGKIDRIYAKSTSRFARNTRDCLKYIRELKSLGITILFEKECIDTAKITDEMMITIMGGLAQEESVSISQNMQWSIQKRMQNGTYRNSTPPFGFRNEDGKLVVDEDQAEIVRQMFEWYISGYGLRRIADMLNEMNIPSGQRCVPWQAKTVQYVLKNERYIGNALYQKSYITETLPHIKKKNYGEKSQYYVTEVNDSIVEKTIFDTAQELMRSRNGKHIDNHLILSKRIYCQKCGATYKFKNCNGKRYWTCRTHDIKANLCENGWILESDIYAAFIRLYNKLLYNYKQILVPLQAALQELKIRRFNGNSNVMNIHKDIVKLREQTHVLAMLKTKGFLDNAKYLEQTKELTAKINRLQSELKKHTRSDDEDEMLEQLEMMIDFFEKRDTPINEFEELAFENIVEKIVVVNPNELEFHLIGGLKFTEKIYRNMS